LEEELEALSVDYLKRIIEEMLPSRMVAMGISIFVVKMEKPIKDHEVNVTYWYHSRWKDIGLRVKIFDKEVDGNNCSPARKHAKK
jgi:hypothetical protein